MSNLADLVRDSAATRPQHPALISESGSLTWRELDDRVDRAARHLLTAAPVRGSRIALMMANRPEFVIAYYAVLRAGHVAVPVNPNYTVPEITRLCADSGAVMLLHPGRVSAVAAGVKQALGDLHASNLHTINVDEPEGLPFVGSGREVHGLAVPGHTAAHSLALLMYTAGSEGQPKGAMLSHGALLANVEMLARLREPAAVEPNDRLLVVLPIFHIFGLNSGLALAAKKGATCVLLERFEPAAALRVISETGVTTVAGAPAMYRAWSGEEHVREALANVRILISGAAALPVELFAEFQTLTGQPIWEGYGLTECSPVVTSSLASGRPKAGSVGRPLAGVEVSLRDHDGLEVEPGDPGELWVRARSLFSGYWPDGHGGPDADGWFPTGDIAVVDEDGDFHLVDRSNDLIIVSGFNVYPREIEDVVAGHPAVAEVAVVGTPHPLTGESVTAFVVLKTGQDQPADLRQYCEARLARFKCPAIINFVDELPHAVTGKVSRSQLRKQGWRAAVPAAGQS